MRISTIIRYFLQTTLSNFSLKAFSSPKSFSLHYSLKIKLWLDDKKERSDLLLRDLLFRRCWTIFASQNYATNIQYVITNTLFLCNTWLWKLLHVLRRPNLTACALKPTARFRALSVPSFPGPKDDASA
jgi:hypothetical protein